MTDRAKPCPKCKMFYPGDCAYYGCKDVDNCPCDGCKSEREWLLSTGCKECGVWASDRSCDCDVEPQD